MPAKLLYIFVLLLGSVGCNSDTSEQSETSGASGSGWFKTGYLFYEVDPENPEYRCFYHHSAWNVENLSAEKAFARATPLTTRSVSKDFTKERMREDNENKDYFGTLMLLSAGAFAATSCVASAGTACAIALAGAMYASNEMQNSYSSEEVIKELEKDNIDYIEGRDSNKDVQKRVIDAFYNGLKDQRGDGSSNCNQVLADSKAGTLKSPIARVDTKQDVKNNESEDLSADSTPIETTQCSTLKPRDSLGVAVYSGNKNTSTLMFNVADGTTDVIIYSAGSGDGNGNQGRKFYKIGAGSASQGESGWIDPLRLECI